MAEIRVSSLASDELPVTAFFTLFSTLAAENGDSPDLEYFPVLKEGARSYRIDGASLDELDGDAGDLHLATCIFRQQTEVPVLNAKDIDSAVDDVERFFRSIASDDFIESLEETSPAYEVAMLVRPYLWKIRRLRVLVLTNGHLRTRRSAFVTRQVGDVDLTVNVLDLERYARIAAEGAEPVEFDFAETTGDPVPCLPVSTAAENCTSYLFAIPGPTLAGIFAAFGNRLLEQNVRTFLQARTNVNKGILRTITEEPGMFFAYNNGITATASEVETKMLPSGGLAIRRVKDFQIVNGGQTTASLLYARDAQKLDLSGIHVQVKLSVVDPERIAETVPRISEYANTQNKVSLSDLASNSPAQVRIERLSKEIKSPRRAGALEQTCWFYERARGQYRNLFAYKSRTERKAIEIRYPKSQLVTKTELAKYELSFDGRPHHVSEGAQKCFNRYVKSVLAPLGDGTGLNATWFQRAMARALLYRELDSAVSRSEWYKADRGYKAQIVTYAVASSAQRFRLARHEIDLDRIWSEQAVPEQLLAWMLDEARRVSGILRNPPEGVRNITEFAKREFCWNSHVLPSLEPAPEDMLRFGVTVGRFAEETQASKRDEGRHRDVDVDVAIAGLMPRVNEIRSAAKSNGLASPKNMQALDKLATGRINLNRGERNALILLLQRLEIEF